MDPTNLRLGAALIVGSLFFAALGWQPPHTEGPASVPLRDAPAAAAAETAEDLAPRLAKSAPKPAPARSTTLAIGEPEGRPTLERVAPRSGPPADAFRSLFPAQASAARTGARGGNHWALIIGINNYAGATRDNIGSRQDAVALRSYLLGLGWREDHIVLLTDLTATRSRVIDGIQWLASKTDDESVALFHYSGHEKPFSTDVDGDGEARDVALWLADNRLLIDGDLGKLLRGVRASQMWLNFAVCRAGGFSDPGTLGAGRLVTYSSPESELSYEDPEVGHSVFGYYSIVEGLRSGYADANGDGLTTVQEAFEYARPRVEERTAGRQHPQMRDEVGSGFSLVAPAPPPPPPEPEPSPTPSPSPTPTPCNLPVGCGIGSDG